MKILIAGSGDTGSHLAKMLSYESQDVVLLSDNKSQLDLLDSNYNIMVSLGNALSVDDLAEAGADEADLFIAVTPSETINIVSCQISRSLGAKRCVARVASSDFLRHDIQQMLKQSGVDSLIYPEMLACREVGELVVHPWAIKWFELFGGRLILAEVRVGLNAPIRDRALQDAGFDSGRLHIVAIRRGGEFIIPHGSDRLLAGDLAYATTAPHDQAYLCQWFGLAQTKVTNIMIGGGGVITELILERLSSKYHITVVEPDAARCEHLSERFPRATVVNTDCRDYSTLRDEGIEQADMFMALTPSDEANLVACMVARKAGVGCSVAEIEDIRYIADAQQLWIDKVVNKKMLTSGHVLRDILGNDLSVSDMLSLEDVEVAEIEVGHDAVITTKEVKNLNISSEMTFGGMIRDGKGMLVTGSTLINAGDRVMVVFRSGCLQKVRRLFR